MKLINPEIRIENTNRCNANCTICPREKMIRKKCTMGFGRFRSLVMQGLNRFAETISIFGYGEPLVDDDLVRKVAYCDFMGLETFITTNASLLSVSKTNKLLNAGLSHIRFSVHGHGKNYEVVHKGLNWQVTLRNIINFIHINKKKYNSQCKVGVTVIPMNDENIEMIKVFWEPKVDYLEIWRPHNWTTGRTYRKTEKKLQSCGRPFTGPVQIQADGKMIVCCFDFNGKLEVGDTYKNTIEEILKGDKFNRIRNKHKAGDFRGLICDSCDQLNIEEESSLIYSSRGLNIGETSSTKFKIEEI